MAHSCRCAYSSTFFFASGNGSWVIHHVSQGSEPASRAGLSENIYCNTRLMYPKICESQSSKFQVAKLWEWHPNPNRFEFPGSSDFSFTRRVAEGCLGRETWNPGGGVKSRPRNLTSKLRNSLEFMIPPKMWGAKKWYLYADGGFQLFAIFFAYNWLLCHIQNLWIELHLTWSPKSCTRRSGPPWPGPLDVDLQTLGSKICSIFYPKYFVKWEDDTQLTFTVFFCPLSWVASQTINSSCVVSKPH